MSWINKNKKVLRVIILALLGAAIIGPWFFDVINVPSEYSCSAPNIRLYGDFCGVPLSMIWILSWTVSGFFYASKTLGTGSMVFYNWVRELLFSFLLFLIILPFFSTLLLILRGERRRLQVFNVVALSLALGVCLLMGLPDYPKLFWVLWGVWLYIGVAAAALVLEILGLVAGRSKSA